MGGFVADITHGGVVERRRQPFNIADNTADETAQRRFAVATEDNHVAAQRQFFFAAHELLQELVATVPVTVAGTEWLENEPVKRDLHRFRVGDDAAGEVHVIRQ